MNSMEFRILFHVHVGCKTQATDSHSSMLLHVFFWSALRMITTGCLNQQVHDSQSEPSGSTAQPCKRKSCILVGPKDCKNGPFL